MILRVYAYPPLDSGVISMSVHSKTKMMQTLVKVINLLRKSKSYKRKKKKLRMISHSLTRNDMALRMFPIRLEHTTQIFRK
jgi:hypothetical protein